PDPPHPGPGPGGRVLRHGRDRAGRRAELRARLHGEPGRLRGPDMNGRPPWLDETRRPPAHVPETASRPAPLLLDDEHRAITDAAGWAARRAQLEERWKTFLGTVPVSRDPAPPTVLERDERAGVDRRLVRYDSEPGVAVEAYLLRP